ALARFAIADVIVDGPRRDRARWLVLLFARRPRTGRARLAIADIVVDLGRPHRPRLAVARHGAGIRPAPVAVAAAPLLALTAARGIPVGRQPVHAVARLDGVGLGCGIEIGLSVAGWSGLAGRATLSPIALAVPGRSRALARAAPAVALRAWPLSLALGRWTCG